MDGEVVLTGTYSDAGNMIVIASSDNEKTIITRYLHLKDKPKYKIGDHINFSDIIGHMGKTGRATGTHLHFEYWICPPKYQYKFQDIYKYAKNPLDYCYIYDGMTVSKSDINLVRHYNDSENDKSNEAKLQDKLDRIKKIIEE